jgi:cytoskeleton protein RodZ
MSETPETSDATTPGELLKQAREREGLSVERVAKDLHLDTQVIRAIEVNHFKDLGAPVYAKGYLRKYARLVGVTEEGILRGYQQMGGTPVQDPIPVSMGSVPESRRPLPRWVSRGVLGLLVLAGLVTLLNMHNSGSDVAQQGALISQPLSAPGSDDGSAGLGDSPLASLPEGSPGMAADTLAGALTIEFKFSGESWVEVHDAENRQVLYELGSAGSTRQIQALPPLRVVLGAANAVGVQVNSAVVTVPQNNIKDGIAHFVVKADGLLE